MTFLSFNFSTNFSTKDIEKLMNTYEDIFNEFEKLTEETKIEKHIEITIDKYKKIIKMNNDIVDINGILYLIRKYKNSHGKNNLYCETINQEHSICAAFKRNKTSTCKNKPLKNSKFCAYHN